VDPHLGGPLAIAGFGADAVPAVPRDGVVRHLDAPSAREHYAAPAPRDVLIEVAVMEHAVLGDLAAGPPTEFVPDALLPLWWTTLPLITVEAANPSHQIPCR
jgi:hypothetical protein